MNKLRLSIHCLIIAEISANHCQDLQKAVEMVKRGKKCGAGRGLPPDLGVGK